MPSAASADLVKLRDAFEDAGQNISLQEVLQSAASYILAEMESRCPVDSGNLRRSLGIRVVGDRVIIGPDAELAPYAAYVEFGTRPHEIRPKKEGGVLVFRSQGRLVYARVVQHPGTKAQPFIRESFDAWVDRLGEMAAEAGIEEIMKGMR